MKKLTLMVAAGLGSVQLVSFSYDTIAQERPAPQLDEVVLVASRSPKKQSDIGKSVIVIGPDVLQKSQGRSLPELLNNVAGISISGANNAPGSPISVFTRGAGRGNTLVLIDGVPTNSAWDIDNVFDISLVAIDQVERIEILKGTNSTLYGSDAVAGVINIVTKHPRAGQKPAASALVTAGSYGTFKEGAGVSIAGETTGFSLNVSNHSSDGFSAAKNLSGTGNYDNDGFTQRSLGTHVDHRFSNAFSVKANLQLNRNTYDLDDGGFSDDDNYTARQASLFAGIDGTYKLKNGTVDLLYNQNNVRYQTDDPETGSDFSRQDNKGKIYYAEAILSQQIVPALGLTAGVNYRYSETDQAYSSQSMFGPYNTHLTYAVANNDIYSAYSSVYIKGGSFRAELGGRYNHHSQYGDNWTYTLNPSFNIGESKVYASLASAFKSPSLYQLTSEYANPAGLAPETTTSYEAGAAVALVPSRLSVDISGFHRHISNLIYFYTDPVTFSGQYCNGNKQDDTGFDVQVKASITDGLHASAWYAFVSGKGKDYNGVETDYLLRRPKNTVGASAGYAFTSAVSLDVTYKFTGKRLDAFGYPTVNIEEHAYTLLDAYIQVLPAKRVTLFADIKNLFDEQYTEWQGYNTRGRNMNAGLKYQF